MTERQTDRDREKERRGKFEREVDRDRDRQRQREKSVSTLHAWYQIFCSQERDESLRMTNRHWPGFVVTRLCDSKGYAVVSQGQSQSRGGQKRSSVC